VQTALLFLFLGRPIRKPFISTCTTQPLSSPLPSFAPGISNQSVIPPAPQKLQISSQPRTREYLYLSSQSV